LDRNRERETQEHPGREVLELLVDVPLEPGELEDRVESFGELPRGETDQLAVDLDVRPRREFRVEPDAELDEGRDAPADPNGAAVSPLAAREHLEQRALPAPVRTDDAEELPRRHGEGDVVQSLVALVGDPLEGMREVLLEPRPLLVRDPEGLRDAHRLD